MPYRAPSSLVGDRSEVRVPVCLFLGLVAALAVSSASPAAAQPEGEGGEWEDSYYPFSRQTAYVGFAGLFALENFDRDAALKSPSGPLDVDANSTGGPQLRLGYRAEPHFAGEILFQYYADFNVATGDREVDDDFDGWSLTFNAKGYPLLGRLQPYGVLGVGALVFYDNPRGDSCFAARLGGGLDLYLTDHVVLDMEAAYLLPTGSLDDYPFTTFALGLQYRY